MSAREASIRARLMDTFRAEATDHVQAMTAGLAALDRLPAEEQAREPMESTFRSAHSLKGAARAMGLRDIEAVCQAMEGLLRGLTRGEARLTAEAVAALCDGVRAVEHILEGKGPNAVEAVVRQLSEVQHDGSRLATTDPEPPDRERLDRERPDREQSEPAAGHADPGPLRPLGQLDSLRVARSRLDDLLLQGEDFLQIKLAAVQRARQARELADVLTTLKSDVSGAPDAVTAAINAAEELIGHLKRDERVTTRYVNRLHRQTRRLRLAPASSVFDLFPLMVGDLAADRGKVIDLVMQGMELEVDLQILEAMKDPLIHLVRNAVDHGIERPEVRAKGGKPRTGRIDLRVTSTGPNRIQICVQDDGAGIDAAQVGAAAARAGLLPAEAVATLSPEIAANLLFRSGFSTSTVITEISGLGLGLAIVRERVEGLSGRVRVESEPGQGTTVRIDLPAAASTFRGLLVRAGGQPFLLAIDAIQRSIRLDDTEIRRAGGRDVLQWNGGLIPIGRLDAMLGLSRSDAVPDDAGDELGVAPRRATSRAVVLQVGEDQAVLVVDEVLGDREVLVRELRAPLVRVRCVAGAGVLGSGDLVLVLRPHDLVQMLHTQPTVPPVVDASQQVAAPTVLVADDSITTRMLIRNILEAAGYQVRVAVDGMDAWTMLQAHRCDLLISDVDMPRMNGYDLTARVRGDPAVKDLPVVLVTALDSRSDKERGIAVGASAYVVKSDMQQSNLLEVVRRLI